jgi:hypothetical protein
MRLLFPYRWKRIGWLLAIPSAVLMIAVLYFQFGLPFLYYKSAWPTRFSNGGTLFVLQDHDFTREVGSVLLIIGLLMIAFSKEKQEDERIQALRLESLLWAVYVNSALLILCIIFLYDVVFLVVMTYNICTPLILFIARFQFVLYTDRKALV